MQELYLRWKHHSFSCSTKLMILTQIFVWNSFGSWTKNRAWPWSCGKKKFTKEGSYHCCRRTPLFYFLSFFLIHFFSTTSIRANNNKECHRLQALKAPNSWTFVVHHELRNGGEQDPTLPFGAINVVTQPRIKRRVGKAHLSFSFCGVGSCYNNYLEGARVARRRTPCHGFVGGWQHLQQIRRRKEKEKKKKKKEEEGGQECGALLCHHNLFSSFSNLLGSTRFGSLVWTLASSKKA